MGGLASRSQDRSGTRRADAQDCAGGAEPHRPAGRTGLKAACAVLSSLCLGIALAAGAGSASPARAAAASELLGAPLSADDAQLYAQAFAASRNGDFATADQALAKVRDDCLSGYVAYQRLMHPKAYEARFEELNDWLARYGDQAGAERVYALAKKRAPKDAPELAAPGGLSALFAHFGGDRAQQAREAYYSGQISRALTLADASGERWIAGLAAYRLKRYAEATERFARVAHDDDQGDWLQAAGGFWAARAAIAAGQPERAPAFLQMAAAYERTFYGIIARRQLGMEITAPVSGGNVPTPRVWRATAEVDRSGLKRLFTVNPRAKRAAALMQVGLVGEADQELRMGLATATDDKDQGLWADLLAALNPTKRGGRPKSVEADYSLPALQPQGGFTLDPALVYALIRQESRFDPTAISSAGAVGLMQLMPATAARTAGDDKLLRDQRALFDPAFNMRVGQDYFVWLLGPGGADGDLLRALAAYNGGPGTLQKTAQQLGPDADTLLLIESLPFSETRNYVEKVAAGYWMYRALWGQQSPSLDAAAAGMKRVAMTMDMPTPLAKLPQPPVVPMLIPVVAEPVLAGAAEGAPVAALTPTPAG